MRCPLSTDFAVGWHLGSQTKLFHCLLPPNVEPWTVQVISLYTPQWELCPLVPCGTSAVAHLRWFPTSDADHGPADAGAQHCQSPVKRQLGTFFFCPISFYAFLGLTTRLDFWIVSTYPVPTSSIRQLSQVLSQGKSYTTSGIARPPWDIWQWLEMFLISLIWW